MESFMKRSISYVDGWIWSEFWFKNLSSNEKLVLIYLLTTSRLNKASFGEFNIDLIVYETGLSLSETEKSLEALEKKGLIKIVDGVIAVKNRINFINPNSIAIKRGVKKILNFAPTWVKNFLNDVSDVDDDVVSQREIQVIRDITGKYPPQIHWNRIVSVFNNYGLHEDILKSTYDRWVSAGFDENELTWLYIWYPNRLEGINNAERINNIISSNN